MVDVINSFLNTAVGYIWGLPMVYGLLGVGLLFTLSLGLIQLRGFRHAIDVVRGKYTSKEDQANGEISHFQALTTALSATVGLGNIGGVAVAISSGGPGAVFWMIVTGFLGMATKYSECTLSMKYRKVDENGRIHGGPMYYILQLGPKFKPLAIIFAFAAVCASFGAANMFQTHEVAAILKENFNIPKFLSGFVLAILTAVVIVGGIRRIGKVTSKLIPLMAVIYITGSLVVIFGHISEVPRLLFMIFSDAFSGNIRHGSL